MPNPSQCSSVGELFLKDGLIVRIVSLNPRNGAPIKLRSKLIDKLVKSSAQGELDNISNNIEVSGTLIMPGRPFR